MPINRATLTNLMLDSLVVASAWQALGLANDPTNAVAQRVLEEIPVRIERMGRNKMFNPDQVEQRKEKYRAYLQRYCEGEIRSDHVYKAFMVSCGFSEMETHAELEKARELREKFKSGQAVEFV